MHRTAILFIRRTEGLRSRSAIFNRLHNLARTSSAPVFLGHESRRPVIRPSKVDRSVTDRVLMSRQDWNTCKGLAGTGQWSLLYEACARRQRYDKWPQLFAPSTKITPVRRLSRIGSAFSRSLLTASRAISSLTPCLSK